MSILLVHEMGHFLAGRRRHLDVTPPYFIPAIPPVGTFGAFIKIRSPIPNRQALIEVGAAGPVCGAIIAIPLLFIGISLSDHPPGISGRDLRHVVRNVNHTGTRLSGVVWTFFQSSGYFAPPYSNRSMVRIICYRHEPVADGTVGRWTRSIRDVRTENCPLRELRGVWGPGSSGIFHMARLDNVRCSCSGNRLETPTTHRHIHSPVSCRKGLGLDSDSAVCSNFCPCAD